MPSSKTEPEQRALRGRTSVERLRHFTGYLKARQIDLLRIADVGFGQTTESLDALARAFPEATVVGLESSHDRASLSPAQPNARCHHITGSELPSGMPPFDVIRAANVLRGYAPNESWAFHRQWESWLNDGGWLLEGTTTPAGDLACFFVMRPDTGPRLVFAYAPSNRGFAPWMFRDWLPQHFRRTVVHHPELVAFFERWTAAWKGLADGADAFEDSARELSARSDVVFLQSAEQAWLEWTLPLGLYVPHS